MDPARPSRSQRPEEECPRNLRKTRKQRIPTPRDHETVIARSVAPKQSSWIATARFAHLAMTRIKKIRAVGIISRVPWAQRLGADPRSQTSCSEIVLRIDTNTEARTSHSRKSGTPPNGDLRGSPRIGTTALEIRVYWCPSVVQMNRSGLAMTALSSKGG